MSEKTDKLKDIMRDLNKDHDSQVAMFAGDLKTKERIATGIKEIDEFLGGGFVCENFNCIYGTTGVGKSTLKNHIIANAQKIGKVCVDIDLEHKDDSERMKAFGIDMEKLGYIENLNTAEEAMDLVIKLCKAKACDIIIIDSISAMSPKGEQETKQGKEKSMEDDEMALLARKLGKFLRVCAPSVAKAKVMVLLIGQIRTMGIGSFHTYAGLAGGNALHHFLLMTLFMREGQGVNAPTIKVKDEEGKSKDIKVGFESVVKIEKKQITGGEREGSELRLPFYFSTGFLKEPIIPKETQEIKEIQENVEKVDIVKEVKHRGRPKGSKNNES